MNGLDLIIHYVCLLQHDEVMYWSLWILKVFLSIYWHIILPKNVTSITLNNKKQHNAVCRLICRFDVYWEWPRHTQNWVSTVHYSNVIMSPTASQITGASIVNSTVYSGAGQRKHQSSASLAFVREIHRWPVKMLPFDDVILILFNLQKDESITAYTRCNRWEAT